MNMRVLVCECVSNSLLLGIYQNKDLIQGLGIINTQIEQQSPTTWHKEQEDDNDDVEHRKKKKEKYGRL